MVHADRNRETRNRREQTKTVRRLAVLGLLLAFVIGFAPNPSMAASAGTPKLKSASIRIGKGKTQKIKIAKIKSKQIKKVTYSSSKKSVAKVNKKGVVTGVKPDRAVITCKVTLKNRKKYTLKARVKVVQMKTKTYTINGADFKMVYVEAGTFTMGSNNQNVEYSESPAHKVTLTKDYYMGETEVTEALWNAVMKNGGGSSTHPKTSVTWKEAHTFAKKLTELARAQGLISDNQSFCLPTEAQWEFAAKGGNLSKGYLYSGSNDIDKVAVTYENSGSDAPVDVKTKAPNELGLYDMSGNAYEWVDDYGGEYSSDAQTDPQNTSGSGYVKRGGSNYHSFESESYLFTTTGRYFYGGTDWTIGFRIILQ